ncbi:M48 family metalloprotease, partial [bacterium]|nr:M48 family metalloprotease [bacterium]
WWVALATFLFLFSVLLAQLAPVLLIPLFFKMNPLPAGELREKLIALSARYGVSVKEVFLLGLGDKTEKGNAAFMGIGRTKRIALGDTIYEKYPANQVLAVFGHELGHMVHGDIWRGLALSTASLFLTFGLAAWIGDHWLLPHWFTWVEAPFGLFLYFLIVAGVGLPFGLLERIHSRWRERLADEFAAKQVGMAPELAGALEALTLQNRSLFKPEGWREWLFYSHPAPWRRILRLRADKT